MCLSVGLTAALLNKSMDCVFAEWRPLDLLLEQPERLVRPTEISELMYHRHILDTARDNLAVNRTDGTDMPHGAEPFAPLRTRVQDLEEFATSTLRREACEPLRQSVLRICDHYRTFVRTVCNFDKDHPPTMYVELCLNSLLWRHVLTQAPTNDVLYCAVLIHDGTSALA